MTSHMSGKSVSNTMPRHILLGVTGSIAAFKAAQLASDWVKQGYQVRVIMTEAATQFISPLTFESLTHQPVRTAMFASSDDAVLGLEAGGIAHIDDAKWADIIVIAPATANVMAKIAAGIADDTLTSTILAARSPIVLAPAMNTFMYDNPVTQRNINTCRELGMTIVEPAAGLLACQDVGKGKLADVADIAVEVEKILGAQSASPSHDTLSGLRVLITAGPTQEPLDPVRFLTNHSTGRMGYAVAEVARDMGADVTLVSGPVELAKPGGITVIDVCTAHDMFDAVRAQADDADLLIMAAAVADFTVEKTSEHKIKKEGRETMTLELSSAPDILAWAGERFHSEKNNSDKVICGFAMETKDLIDNAEAKLFRKHADMIVANSLTTPGAGFGTDTNVATLLTVPADAADEPIREDLPLMSKHDVAVHILTKMNAIKTSRE